MRESHGFSASRHNESTPTVTKLCTATYRETLSYSGANQLTSLTAVNTSNGSLLNTSYQYGYDPLGLTDAITTTVQGSPSTQTLAHDAAGRLTAVRGGSSPGSWSYDGRGT